MAINDQVSSSSFKEEKKMPCQGSKWLYLKLLGTFEDRLVKLINFLNKLLDKFERKNKNFKNKILILKTILSFVSLCNDLHNITIKELEENENLRCQVDHLKLALEKFTISSNSLNMVIGR